MTMIISKEMEQALNDQIGHEYGASLQYVSIATYFDSENLFKLAGLFYKQADEEKEHAHKLIKYLVGAGAQVRIPAIPQPKYDFASAEAAVKLALDWEMEVKQQFDKLTELALAQRDHLSHHFLASFVLEQLEELSSMDRLLDVNRRAGRNLLMVEAYLVHDR